MGAQSPVRERQPDRLVAASVLRTQLTASGDHAHGLIIAMLLLLGACSGRRGGRGADTR